MRVTVLYAYADDAEYRRVDIDHASASAERVAILLKLKYEALGVLVRPEIKEGERVYLRIPATRKNLRPSRLKASELEDKLVSACVRMSDPSQACGECGSDHSLLDLVDELFEPGSVDPYRTRTVLDLRPKVHIPMFGGRLRDHCLN